VATGRITEDGVKDALGRARKLWEADASEEVVSFDPDEEPEDPEY
jgi:sigma54-dependent transcription regulator